MWKKTTIKEPKSSSDLRVSIVVNETCQVDYITYAEQWGEAFKKRLEALRSPGGGHSIANYYKAKPRNEYSVEVWKLDSKGDYKELRWVVTFL